MEDTQITENSLPMQYKSDLTVERAAEIEREFRNSELPHGYTVNESGVWYQSESADQQRASNATAVCSPLYVVAIVRDHSNENYGRLLEFIDVDGNVHKWVMPQTLLAGDYRELRLELLSKGLLIHSRKLLTEYIQACLPQRRARCTQQTGWVQDHFVLPNLSIPINHREKLLFQPATTISHGYTSKGNLDRWTQMSSLCRGNSRLLFAVSAAFAPPLLHLQGEESGGFHFRGISSIGKTTLLRVAASVWGDKSHVQTWRATANGLESIAAAHSDTLLALDEMSQSNPNEVGEVAYMLANGCGKSRADRAGQARKRHSWRLLFLSTGEVGLADHNQVAGKKTHAGQEIRILDIAADTGLHGIYETLHGYANGAELSRCLPKMCDAHHGIASQEFITQLIANKEAWIAKIQSVRNELKKNNPEFSSGQVARAFDRFTLVAAAGELAAEMGIVAWQPGEASQAAITCFKSWLLNRGGTGPLEEQNILTQVRRFIEQHGESRFSPWNEEDPTITVPRTQNRVGFRRIVEGTITFYVFKESFRTDVCAGLDYQTSQQVLIKRGWLIGDGQGNPTKTVRLPGGGMSRVYVLTNAILDDKEMKSSDEMLKE